MPDRSDGHCKRGALGKLAEMWWVSCAVVIAVLAAPVVAQGPEGPAYVTVNINAHTAPVRDIAFSPDSNLMITAGMDKVAHVWSLEPSRPGARPMIIKERTLRREIARGLGGIIYAIASHPSKNELVVGGYGARKRGDLSWFDPRTEQFLTTRYGDHLAPVTGLAFSRSGRWLASIDKTGQALLRSDRAQPPRQLNPAESAQQPDHWPIAIVGDSLVLIPVPNKNGQWRLKTYEINANRFTLLDQDHKGHVTALAACPNGRLFASADVTGQVFVWQVGQTRPWKTLTAGRPVIALSFDPTGRHLAAGTSLLRIGGGGAEMQLWNVESGQMTRQRQLANNVYGCEISPDGRYLAYGGGELHQVFVEDLQNRWQRVSTSGGTLIQHVRFGRKAGEPPFRFQTNSVESGPQWKSLDLSQPELEVRESQPAIGEPSSAFGTWSYRADPTKNQIRLLKGQQARGYVQLDAATQGKLECQCWIPGPGGEPSALAVGTDIYNQVYIYGLPAGQTPAPMLRYFRGHHAVVRSVHASRDGRWLASGGDDGTVSFWSLQGLANPTIKRRWGIEVREEGGRLMVKSVDKLGPLYQKGLRAGDQIQKIGWPTAGPQPGYAKTPGDIQRQLGTLPWNKTVYFWTQKPGNVIALQGAWTRAMSLFMDDREWIAWTPAGYYDCSPGGERMMGWIVNQPAEVPEGAAGEQPVFYLAEQVNQRLFKPKILGGLLRAGDLDGALDNLRVNNAQRIESPAELQPPKVEIIEPQERYIDTNKPTIKISAKAIPVGEHPVTEMRIQVGGRDRRSAPAGLMKSVSLRPRNVPTDEKTFTLDLQPGINEIMVIAKTAESDEGHSDLIIVDYKTEAPEPSPTLYAVCVGISAYQDDSFSALEFAHLDAEKIANVFKAGASELYTPVQVKVLTEQKATKQEILSALRALQANMKSTDVGVFFYSGHGWRDEQTNIRYLIPIDGKNAPNTFVSEKEVMEILSKTEGNLVLMLDACHSGGIGMDDLARIMGRENPRVNVFASSQGTQQSIELKKHQAGVFALSIFQGLKGAAEGTLDDDNHVRTSELQNFVDAMVEKLTEGIHLQEPTYVVSNGRLNLTTKLPEN